MTLGPGPDASFERDAGGVLTVDLGALAANWSDLASLARGADCAAVVKADAYGLGIEAAVPALARAGCRTFFVAHLSEGVRARRAAPDAAVYVLNGLPPGSGPTFAEHRLRPVLGSAEEIAEWAGFTRAQAPGLPAALHVDTGMNRLGLAVRDAIAMGPAGLGDCRIDLLMSHFLASETPGHPATARQIEAFAAARAAFPGVRGSLANSAGVFLGASARHDLVRPGYALYGGNPFAERSTGLRPVVRLEARVVQVRDMETGDTVGYHGSWMARGRRRIATVSVGYADGYPRSASAPDGRPGGRATVAGVICPLVGSVSMDLLAVDVTDVPAPVRRGDLVALLDETITIDALAADSGRIGYEILVALGRRYARRTLPAA